MKGGAVFPPCCLTWGQIMVEVMKIMATSFKRSHVALLHSVSPSQSGHRWPTPLPETSGHSWACLGQFLVESPLLSLGSWCPQGFVCALQDSVSTVLYKFWWFYGGVNHKLLQEGLCHTLVCCTQSPFGSATAGPYLRRRHSHSSGLVSVGWACVLCPSQVWAAQTTRCLVSTLSQVYHAS